MLKRTLILWNFGLFQVIHACIILFQLHRVKSTKSLYTKDVLWFFCEIFEICRLRKLDL